YAPRTLADRAGIPSVGVGLMFQEALGIDGCFTPLARRGNGLTVNPVGHIARREDPRDARRRPRLGDRDVPRLVQRELAAEQRGVRVVSDRDEEAVRGEGT